MRVVDTGGTGRSGSYIIPELVAAGHEVTGLARPETAAVTVLRVPDIGQEGQPRFAAMHRVVG